LLQILTESIAGQRFFFNVIADPTLPTRSLLLTPQLIIRESCGAYPPRSESSARPKNQLGLRFFALRSTGGAITDATNPCGLPWQRRITPASANTLKQSWVPLWPVTAFSIQNQSIRT